jgi:MtN3 and saliva related transmembrane protein
MTPLDGVGYTAAVLMTISFLPQVIKIWRSKKADDISIPAFLAFFFGVLCWLIFGILSHSPPMIVANSITLLLAAAVLVLAWRYRNRR